MLIFSEVGAKLRIRFGLISSCAVDAAAAARLWRSSSPPFTLVLTYVAGVVGEAYNWAADAVAFLVNAAEPRLATV